MRMRFPSFTGSISRAKILRAFLSKFASARENLQAGGAQDPALKYACVYRGVPEDKSNKRVTTYYDAAYQGREKWVLLSEQGT